MKFTEVDFARIVASDKKYPEIFGPTEYPCSFKKKKMRVDILTQDHVYECKFGANAWKEALGQSLTYSMLIKKKAGVIVFIRTNPKFHERDMVGFEIMKKTIKEYSLPIDVRRFYVNQTTGKISCKNTLKWETTKEKVNELEEAFKLIEKDTEVHKGVLSRLFNRRNT